MATKSLFPSSVVPRVTDQFKLQDLYHYALALQGKDNATEIYGLKRRLGAVDLIARIIGDRAPFTSGDDVRSEAELISYGRALLSAVKEWAASINVDPETGEVIKSGAEKTIYATSYCNFGHDVKTGRPVGHECYILPPAALKAEQAGDDDEANRILQKWSKGPRKMVRGR